MQGISTSNGLWRERHRTECVVLVILLDTAFVFRRFLLLLSNPGSRLVPGSCLVDGGADGFANEIYELLRLLFEVEAFQFNYNVLGKLVDTTVVL